MDSGIGSFLKLLEVGFSPYLCFIPIFKGFSMFRLVLGREGPFDRSQNMGPNCGNFFEIFGLAVTAQKISGMFGCFYFT